MPLLIESLRAEDGRFEPLWPHEERMNRSRRELFGIREPFVLAERMEEHRDKFGPGLWKVRILYEKEIRAVEATPYTPRFYGSAALVDGSGVKYAYKAAERSALDALTEKAVRLGADTALIVADGFLTDFSYANAVFFDGDEWFTPARPLLMGTRRARLLSEGRIKEAALRPAELGGFIACGPINAMLDLEAVVMDIGSIVNQSDFGGLE